MRKLCAAYFMASLILGSACLSVRGQEPSSLDSRLASPVDLETPAPAAPLRLQRKSVPGRTQRGLLGTRWRHNWESRLLRAANRIQIEDWAGVTLFTQVGRTLVYRSESGAERVTFSKDGRAVRAKSDGSTETFDAAGRLVERTTRKGGKFLLRYTPQGRLARVEGPGGSFISFTADPAGNAIRASSSTGAIVRYAYNKDDLVEVQVNGGPALRYGYDAGGRPVRIEDPQTGALDIAYDSKERVTGYRRADGSAERFEYDDAAKTTRAVAANGAVTVTREDAARRLTEVTDPLGHKSVVRFDEAGRLTSVEGPAGALSRLTYDALGRVASSEDPLGRTTRYDYAGDSSAVRTIIHADGTRQEFEYDADENLTAVKVGGKVVSALTYNPDGSIAAAKEPGAKERKFTYHPNGLVKSEANALGESTQFEYDARGNLTRETNPLGGVIVRAYDQQDRIVSLTDPAGATTRYEYDARGRLMRETDPAGGATTFEYDAVGRLVAETNSAGQTTRYEYTPADEVAKVSGPGGGAESYVYDLAGNLTARTDRLGRTTKFEYDAAGRVTRELWPTGLEVRYRYDAAGNLLAVENNGGAKSEYQSDASGQTATRTNPDGGKVQYRFDALGNLLSVTDPLNRVKEFTHTDDGDLTEVAEASRDAARYERDAAGRVVAARRPGGGMSRFTYDRMGNVLTATDPLGGVKRYEYDKGSRLLSSTDAAGKVTRHVYDAAGRRVEKQLPDGKRVAYKYDALGRMIEADDGAFPVRTSYDAAGNVSQVEYAAIKTSVGYEYDAQGLRTKLIAPDGRETRYEYDQLKRLSAVVPPDGKRITLGYDAKNRIQSVSYPNGITGRWEYDAAGRAAKISYQDKGGKPVAVSSYRYDPAGNTVERQDAKGKSSRFTYDAANQLVEEIVDGNSIKYGYAAGGNRAEVAEGARVSRYKHDAADKLVEAGAEQFSYDLNGNLTGRKGPGGATTYEYDAEDRLIKIVAPGGATTTFGYAPTGERAWRRDKGSITYFLYDGLNLIAELGEDFRTKKSFVHGFGIDRPLAMLQEKQSFYYLADRLGSITHLTDDKGKVTASYNYDAFGKIRAKQGTITNPFAYTGRELDPTGLYYFRARYYDPALGRFLANDSASAPLDEPLELNPYLYVRNNPLGAVDPLGLSSFTPEYLNGQSDSGLIDLYEAHKGEHAAQEQVYRAMRSRGMGTPRGDKWFYARPVPNPAGGPRGLAWDPGSPPALENAPPPSAAARPQQQVVGRPGQAGAVNHNPAPTGEMPAARNNPTGAVNGGSPNRAGANTGAMRPQPGAPRVNTLQIGEAARGGDTIRVPTGGVPGKGFWTLDPTTVRSGIKGAGTAASVLAAAADCYRKGLENCGPKIATGIVVGGIVKGISAAPGTLGVIGKALGPIGTLVAGGKAWREVNKELSKGRADEQQRGEQAKARQAQEQANLRNRDAFYPRIEQLRAKINSLRKEQGIILQSMPKALAQAALVRDAEVMAKVALETARYRREQSGGKESAVCAYIQQNRPAALKAEIDALAGQAESARAEVDRLHGEAKLRAANCSSAEDAAAIKAAYNRIKALTQQIAKLKTSADQKNAMLEDARAFVASNKAALPRSAVMIDEQLSKAETAARETAALVTRARDAKEKIDAGLSGPQLRREINALHGAVPEAALASMQDKFNELHALLSEVTKQPAPPVERYDLQAEESLKRVRIYHDQLRLILRASSDAYACDTNIPSAEAVVGRINTALTMAGLQDAAPLLQQAQICEASGKCIPAINGARGLLERLEIEAGEAAINQARQQGCNVEGLLNALDYYRTIRNAAAALFNAKEGCKFEEGLAFAAKMPASMQSSPWLANGIAELRAGAAAREQVEQLVTRATNASSRGSNLSLRSAYQESRREFAQADAYVAQAERAAASYPCLAERVSRYRGEHEKLKQAVNRNSGGRGATTEESDETATDSPVRRGNNPLGTGALGSPVNRPKVEEIPEDSDDTASNRPPRRGGNSDPRVEEIPEDDGRTPTASNTSPGRRPRTPPVEEIPEDEGAGRSSSDNNSRAPANQSGDKPKKEKKPKDPNKPSKWDRFGAALGGAVREAINPNAGGGNSGVAINPGGSAPGGSQLYAFVLKDIGLVVATGDAVNTTPACQWNGGGPRPCPGAPPAQVVGTLGGPYASEQDAMNDLKTRLDCLNGYWGLFINYGSGRAWLQNNVTASACRSVKQL